MKNQYFGDINDFRKYGFLRVLQAGHRNRLLLNWMLVGDDSRRDGEIRGYLNGSKRSEGLYGKCDQSLFIWMKRHGKKRDVHLIEKSGLLERTSFFCEEVPPNPVGRELWCRRLIPKARGVDLVFFDPDNGFPVKSKREGHPGFQKYIAESEVKSVWAAGKSLVVYQHARRIERHKQVEIILNDFKRWVPGANIKVYRAGSVLYFAAFQKNMLGTYLSSLEGLKKDWKGQIQELS